MFRQEKYLLTPHEETAHVAINGKELDHDLIKFNSTARENRARYCDAFLDHRKIDMLTKQSSVPFGHKQVFVTKEERQKHTSIEKLSKEKVKDMVEAEILKILDVQDKESYQHRWKVEMRKKVVKQKKNLT